jgi:hypothetical protein
MLELSRHVFISGWRTDDPTVGLDGTAVPQYIAVSQFGVLYTQIVATSPGSGSAGPLELVADSDTFVAPEGLPVMNFPHVYLGATGDWVRPLAVSAENLNPGVTSGPRGAAITGDLPEWSLTHTPAVGVRATITQAASATRRHVCRSISATLAVAVADVGVAGVLVNLRDGATGAGTILWSGRLAVVDAAGGMAQFALSGLNIVGSINTAMTLEFAAAPGAASFETVAISGATVQN